MANPANVEIASNNNHNCTIATHGGMFHADDAVACAIILCVHPDAEIVRTRDEAVIAASDIVVDVGTVYDPAQGRFDHHQEGGGTPAHHTRTCGTPFAAAGLVWATYGKRAIEMYTPQGVYLSAVEASAVVETVDAEFIRGVDARDYALPVPEGTFAQVSGVIHNLNPTFLDSASADEKFVAEAIPTAMDALAGVIRQAIARVAAAKEVAEAPVTDGVLVLERFVPWSQQTLAPTVKFVVFPTAEGEWMVQCAPTSPGSFEARHLIPTTLSAKRGAELVAALVSFGMTQETAEGAIFIHRFLFIGGHKTREGAIAMGRLFQEHPAGNAADVA